MVSSTYVSTARVCVVWRGDVGTGEVMEQRGQIHVPLGRENEKATLRDQGGMEKVEVDVVACKPEPEDHAIVIVS
jgi:hypothetical protein